MARRQADRAPANAEVLTRLLARRHELATALGWLNWADYITEDKMIRSGKAASEFIERISTAARPRSRSSSPSCWRASARTTEERPGSRPGTTPMSRTG